MINRFLLTTFFVITSLLSLQITGQNKYPNIKEKTSGMQKYSGFFNFYWDTKEGKIWLEIDKLDYEFLYVNSLPRGVGSNDIGLDRGQLGSERVVKFERYGPRILLVEPNYYYRAISDNESEQKAVEQSFAKSVLHGFEVVAEEDNNILIDASTLFLKDERNVAGTLKRTNQGNYTLDLTRSAFYLENTKNFPLNTEVEVILTFTGKNPGSFVRQVVPTPNSITVYQRHSFVKLPDDKYKKRKLDPRAGYFGVEYMDYATQLDEPILKRFISRHRLEKKNQEADISEAVEPIIYYVDPGVPEPVRSALVEGASWWNQAFEAAGFKDAFQVKILPADADPMDIRYNVIQWVHRSTRGWSYGGGVIDPRTGEIIKGHVSLGSLRVRQDYLIAEGLLAPYDGENNSTKKMEEMSLARIRQLSAHEVGHTLGLSHNFAASTFDRASVMDYPHPLIRIDENGNIELSDAYDNKIGEWDKVAIKYGYSEFNNSQNEKEELNKIIQDAAEKGLYYIGDKDGRQQHTLHSTAHIWDNGKNAIDELNHIMKVRKIALENFSQNNIKPGQPYATLEDVLVPVYLLHRYQTAAATKLLGGSFYTYSLKGDNQTIIETVPGDEQRRALSEVINTIKPENLKISERILNLIPPRPEGYPKTREHFKTYTGMKFDPIAAAESAANLSLNLIFNSTRCARLVENNSVDNSYPSLEEVIDKVIISTWKETHKDNYSAEINRAVSNLVLNHLFGLASNEQNLKQVRAIASLKINELNSWIDEQSTKENDVSQKAHYLFAKQQIELFWENPADYKIPKTKELPAGSPIGMD